VNAPHRWLNVDDAAEYLGVKAQTVRRWAVAGAIPAHRVVGSRLIRFRTDELDDAMVRREVERATDQ